MSNPVVDHKLQEHLLYLAENSPYYKRLFAGHNISVNEIKTAADLQKIPLTGKKELQAYNRDFTAAPPEKLIDYITTSGTTGKPVVLALTEKDLERLADNECGSFKIADLEPSDIIQLMTTIDRRFMAGMAYFLGARKLGAGIIRVGNGVQQLQWDTIFEMNPTTIICVPSFLLKLIEFAEQHNIDYRNCSVKKALCIGEPLRNPDFSPSPLAQRIMAKWPLDLRSTYASSEMATAFTECKAHRGVHIQEHLVVVELLNDQGKPVNNGEAGELVVTPLGVEGMPLLRFQTGDICSAHVEPCSCGRTSLRLGPIIGRKDQRIKYKGTSLFPSAIYTILQGIPAIRNFQIEATTGELGTDEVVINIGLEEGENLTFNEISDIFKAKLRVVPTINFLPPSEIERRLFSNEGRKPQVFVDKRVLSK